MTTITDLRPAVPAGGLLLDAAEVAAAADAFFRAAPSARRWDVRDLDLDRADANLLTDSQVSAVRFITLIEDHLPGYFALYERHFPADGTVDEPAYLHNRELYHFTVRWAAEEDTHARALTRYQIAAGIADEPILRTALAAEGRKEFVLPFDHAVQFFTYALVQEKATQIYYQRLRDVVADPVLRDLLTHLSRDEARHFTFMSDILTRYLRTHGDAVVDPVREVIATFRMPLSDTIRGYWRWAFRIADAARYDHTEAYVHLVHTINRAVAAKSDRLTALTTFVTDCRTVGTT